MERPLALLLCRQAESTFRVRSHANGNLTSRTDANGTVTAWSLYDALNRPGTKSYSDHTPAVAYAYDIPFKGALSSVATAAYGTIPATATTYNSYDSMGRATQSTQTTGNSSFHFSYAYNRNGDRVVGAVSERAASGNMLDDAAARPAQVQNFATQTNYVSGVQYAPQGAVSQIDYHNGAVQTTSYNSRLEPLAIGLTLRRVNVLALGYDYGSGTPAANGGPSSNVGNVQTATIQPNSAAAISQTFQYNPLDRLILATENPTSPPAQGSPCPAAGGAVWCEQYGYNDAWGNRRLAGNTNSPGIGAVGV